MTREELQNLLDFSSERMRALEKSGNMMAFSAASLEHIKHSLVHNFTQQMLDHVLPIHDENIEMRARIRRLEEIILHYFSLEKH